LHRGFKEEVHDISKRMIIHLLQIRIMFLASMLSTPVALAAFVISVVGFGGEISEYNWVVRNHVPDLTVYLSSFDDNV
jgi:hypothetical protein